MKLILKRLITLVTRVIILVTLFRYASTYLFSKKVAMTVAPVVALSHGGGEIILHSFITYSFQHPLPFLSNEALLSTTYG